MELLGKIYFLFKIAVFALLIWKYGFNGFEKYNKDFDNYYSTFIEPHIESILAFTAGSTVGISEILRTHQADLSGLFFLMATSLVGVIIKALLTVLVTFYFTKFLRNPPKALEWLKDKFLKKKSQRKTKI
jgi:predicted PurR-regulated permease PerM